MKKTLRLIVVASSLVAGACGPADNNGDDEPCVLEVSEDVTEETQWECPTILLQESIDVRANLTISPGTEVIASSGKRIEVIADGAITANGTPDEPIAFRGEEDMPGFWGGIFIQTVSEDNSFDQVSFANGGGDGFQGLNASLALLGGGVPEGGARINDVTVRNAAGYGISLGRGSKVLDNGNWTFEEIEGPEVRAAFSSAHRVGFGTEGPLDIEVFGGTLTEEVTWGVGARYFLTETPKIEEGGHLRIFPGEEVVFSQDVYLQTGPSGAITVRGSEEAPVILRGAEEVPGFWGGLGFRSLNTDNKVEHAVIEYGGGNNYSNTKTSLLVGGSNGSEGYVEVSNTTIRHSEGPAINIKKGGTAILENVTYEDNGEDLVDENES